MIQQLLDSRKLKRAVELINSNEPDKAAAQLQTILNESLIAYSSNNSRLQKSALNEVSNIRNALVAKQIDAGEKTANYAIAFNSMVEKFETALQDTTNDSNTFTDSIKSIGRNIPSADTFTTALITANPLLGYGVKMVRDVSANAAERLRDMRANSAKRANEAEEQKRQLFEIIEKQDNEDIAENVSAVDQSIDDSSDLVAEKLDKTIEGIKGIEHNTDALLRIWDDNYQDTKLDKLVELTEEQNDLERERMRSEEIDAIKNSRSANKEQVNQLPKSENNKNEDNGSLLSGLGLGLGFGSAGFLGRLKTFFAGFSKIGKVLRVASKFAVIGTVIASVVDLVDGFYDAQKYFDGVVGIKERIVSGISSFISGIIKTVDTVLGFFGLDFLDMEQDELTQKIVDGYNDLELFISDSYTGLKNGIKEMFGSVVDSVSTFFTNIINEIDSIINAADEFIDDAIGNVKDFFGIGEETKTRSQVQSERRNNVSDLIEPNNRMVGGVGNTTVVNAPTNNVINAPSTVMGASTNSRNNDSDISGIRSRSNARRR